VAVGRAGTDQRSYQQNHDMRKKKKPIFKATCKYCNFYQPSHTCALSEEKVKGSIPACNDFSMADTFWCGRNNYQVDTAACLNRQDHGCHGCVRCWQGEGIRGILNQFQLSLFKIECLPERKKHENQVGL